MSALLVLMRCRETCRGKAAPALSGHIIVREAPAAAQGSKVTSQRQVVRCRHMAKLQGRIRSTVDFVSLTMVQKWTRGPHLAAKGGAAVMWMSMMRPSQ